MQAGVEILVDLLTNTQHTGGCNMKYIGRAVAGVGCIAAGLYGYNTDIIGSGWLVFLGVMIILSLN